MIACENWDRNTIVSARVRMVVVLSLHTSRSSPQQPRAVSPLSRISDILRQPSDTVPISCGLVSCYRPGCPQSVLPTLPHNNAAHKDLDRSDAFKGHLAFACCLIKSQLVSQLIFRQCIGMIYLVSQDKERDLAEILHREEGIELSFCFGNTFMILGINEEDYAGNLGEVIAPQAAC